MLNPIVWNHAQAADFMAFFPIIPIDGNGLVPYYRLQIPAMRM
jgi:hypothetical protein